MTIKTEKIYQNYVDKYGERSSLFELLQNKFEVKKALYPGSAIHITPSFYFPESVYVDTWSKAKPFFQQVDLIDFISNNKHYDEVPVVRFYALDYRKKIDEEENYFDLLISQYAGFVSKYYKKYLKSEGVLVANNSHGDASMASIDDMFQFFAVINRRSQKYYYSEKNLSDYFIPKKQINITEEFLEKRQRGIGYTKSASLYLFKKINEKYSKNE